MALLIIALLVTGFFVYERQWALVIWCLALTALPFSKPLAIALLLFLVVFVFWQQGFFRGLYDVGREIFKRK